MKPGKGKEKGSVFEREACQFLSLWVTEGVSKDLFWRSSNSGGRATVNSKRSAMHEIVSGDICAIDPRGHRFLAAFSVECKHVAALDLQSLIYKQTPPVVDFWDQACRDARRQNVRPMLYAKQNRKPVLVGLRRQDLQEIEDTVMAWAWSYDHLRRRKAGGAGSRLLPPPAYLYSSKIDLCLVLRDELFRYFLPVHFAHPRWGPAC